MALVTKRHTNNAEEAFHDIVCRWNALQLLVLDTFFIETTALAEALDEAAPPSFREHRLARLLQTAAGPLFQPA
ncbi:hypothetical protein PI124_g10681 [Phytophthora idaei]|nr:hypothetical protein PI125_g16894 [Phytophthora idaei]KAG3141820.1 hypothetical protein PI126_g15319 [Phytophthora idaei]KAG3244554.1 hypothetical protein PI124_g10681 [Phytophthora idaei]